MKWDRERVVKILEETYEMEAVMGVDALVELVEVVRAEAIGWCWVEACNQYSRGMNPGDQNMPTLLDKALLDLNPERK